MPTSPPLSAFAVRCRRHPRHHRDAYDARSHRYSPSYVSPETWLLDLDASAGVRVIVTPDPPDDLPRAEPEDHGEIRVPGNVAGYHWSVARERMGRFVEVATRAAGRVPRVTVPVPTEGAREARFRVRLRVARSGADDLEGSMILRLRDLLIVSLGDSYASGEGNPDRPGEDEPLPSPLLRVLAKCPMRDDPVWQEPAAHRSYVSGPSFAADFAEFRGASASTRERTIIAPTFLSFASSGATIGHLTTTRQHTFQRVPQLAEARAAVGDRPVDAVIISAGGNDAGFGRFLREVTSEGGRIPAVPPFLAALFTIPSVSVQLLGFLASTDGEAARRGAVEAARRAIVTLPDRYVELAKQVEEHLAPRHVFVTTYPERLFERHDGSSAACELFDVGELDVSSRDIAEISDLGARLNTSLDDAVKKIGEVSRLRARWHLVDGVAQAFRRHGYCAREPFLRKLGESCQVQGDIKGGMHPNVAGVRAYAELIYRALDQHLLGQAPAPDVPRADIDVSPDAVAFGSVPVGELRIRRVTIKNAGEVTLTVDTPAGSGPISWHASRVTLRPGQRTAISVRFLPSSAGNQTATLRVTSAAPGSPHRVSITGRAIGGTHTPGGGDGPVHPN